MNQRRDALEMLFDATTAHLLSKLQDGSISSGELATARQMLKDNDIQADPAANRGLNDLYSLLPTFDGEDDTASPQRGKTL